MRHIVGTLAFCLLLMAGCSFSPPKPPMPKGEYHPINVVKKVNGKEIRQPIAPRVFDFLFDGDITDSLNALHIIQPQTEVLQPLGKAIPVRVRVDLHGVTLESALRAIGEQGGDVADVVWNTENKSNQVYVRFHSLEQQTGAVVLKPAPDTN